MALHRTDVVLAAELNRVGVRALDHDSILRALGESKLVLNEGGDLLVNRVPAETILQFQNKTSLEGPNQVVVDDGPPLYSCSLQWAQVDDGPLLYSCS